MCNFVNVYTIAYRCTVHVYTRASLTDILARKIAPRVGQVGEDVSVDVRVGVVECQLNHAMDNSNHGVKS